MNLTPDQLRQNAAAMLALADGKPIQVFWRDEWEDYTRTPNDWHQYRYRAKPEPATRPWDFNSRPTRDVWVHRPSYVEDHLIIGWTDFGVKIGHLFTVTYADFMKDWLQRDGSPCGITEDAK